ncbi:MAG: hypothetical protein K8L91_11375 [Anaerolineae bacterium]|nr:hypothetical protein [Anaerolineae bacterium]
MTRQRLCFLFLTLTLLVGALGIQPPTPKPAAASYYRQEVNTLAMAIDNRASMNGLSSGDGSISPAEYAISEVIWNDINSFNTDLEAFEQANTLNATSANALETTMTNYYEQVANPTARPDAEMNMTTTLEQQSPQVSDPVALEQIKQSLTTDLINYMTWQELINAADEYFNENPTSMTAEEVSNALYLEQIKQSLTTDILNELAKQELIEAGNQYLAENSPATPDKVGQTVKDGTSDYIKNDPKIKRKNINRKRAENMIEFYVPSQMLPINGRWRVRPYTTNVIGDCFDTDTWAQGEGGGSDEEELGDPLCGYENLGGLPFITWQAEIHMYLPGTSSIYSDYPRTGYLATRSQANGPLDSSRKYVTTVEYEVVAPDRILVHYLARFDGGCAIEATYEIVLVKADESVCSAQNSYVPQDATQPGAINPVKDDDELPIEEPPVFEGPYTVGMPIGTAPQCEFPAMNEIRLLDQGNGALVMDYGTGQKTLYRDSVGYTYDSGLGATGWENLSLFFNSNGNGYLTWNKTDATGQMCSVSQDLYLPGQVPVDTPTQPTDSTGSSDAGPVAGGTLTDGEYAVEWSIMESTCPADLQAVMPAFANVTVTFNDKTVVLSYDGGEIVLDDMMGLGTYMYMDMTGSPMLNISLTNVSGMDVQLSWMAMSQTGSTCTASTTFAQ